MLDYNKIKVGIIDLGINNIFSIHSCFKNIGYKTSVLSDNENFKKFDVIVLPGVGAFKMVMKNLKERNLINKIQDITCNKNQLLFGVCLGMQLMFEESEEFGKTKGLNILEGKVLSFPKTISKIPHITWAKVNFKKNDIFKKNDFYYFVHSYYCSPKNKSIILAESKNNKKNFCSIIHHKNILASQFHPEKSGKVGINFLQKMMKFI